MRIEKAEVEKIREAIAGRPARCCAICENAAHNAGNCLEDRDGREGLWTVPEDAACQGKDYAESPTAKLEKDGSYIYEIER